MKPKPRLARLLTILPHIFKLKLLPKLLLALKGNKPSTESLADLKQLRAALLGKSNTDLLPKDLVVELILKCFGLALNLVQINLSNFLLTQADKDAALADGLFIQPCDKSRKILWHNGVEHLTRYQISGALVASDSRALTLKLLADTADFQKKLQAGSKDIDSIGERAAEFGKKAAIAFAAAGAAVGAFALSAVKAAAEDEAAQLKLAETIRSTTKATDDQIKGVERYITQTSIAAGITDDELRPAFSRLVRSTNDVEDAQKLLNLALDLSAATGKPLESVTNALGRAYDGNTTALGKLGLGIDAADLKSQDFDTTFQQLTSTFGNFSENQAQSTQKQMERVKIALDEAKESIGAALLPVMQDLTAFLLDKFIPALESFIAGLTGNGGLDESLTQSQRTALEWGKKVRGFIDTVIELKDELIALGTILTTIFVATKIIAGIQAFIGAIGLLTAAFGRQTAAAAAAGVATAYATGGVSIVAASAALAAIGGAAFLYGKLKDAGDEVRSQKTGAIGNFSMSTSAATDRSLAGLTNGVSTSGGLLGGLGGGGGGGGSNVAISKPSQTLIEQVSEANFIKRTAGTGSFDVAGFRQAEERGNVVINVNAPSVIDEEGFSRAVALALNNSSRRLGGGGDQLIL